jgi:hypothetical protein
MASPRLGAAIVEDDRPLGEGQGNSPEFDIISSIFANLAEGLRDNHEKRKLDSIRRKVEFDEPAKKCA